jgi:large subunit ribosomal protein L18
MTDKKASRIRRGTRTRAKISRDRVTRMCIFRTPRHIYAQIIDSSGSRVLASASTVEADVKSEIKNGGNIAAAAAVGKRIAEKAKAAGVDSVAFDRSGFRYHGRVKALADAAREGGLQF